MAAIRARKLAADKRALGRTGRPARTVVLVAVALVMSGGLSVVAAVPGSAGSSAAPHASAASASPTPAASRPVATATDPHPGTLEIDEVEPNGANSVDPALGYYQVDEEPMMNVYEPLVAYNGSSLGAYVPVAATCVPGTVQCSEDYGAGFTGIANATGQPYTGTNGEPIYWTFVLDPAAHFYDPATFASWPVYPSDVIFSAARSLAFSDPFGLHPGWPLAQALLSPGDPLWDGGLHAPYNTTPYDILSSMFVNDSAFCPAAAMDGVHGDGCITFDAGANGTDWPMFEEFLAPPEGLYITPCGWASASPQDAGLPGFPSTHAPQGDGSCLLPGNVTSTSTSGFRAFLNSTLSPTGRTRWDPQEAASAKTIVSGLQRTMVGSGPYAATVNLTSGYRLATNPAYGTPSGCGGDPTDFPGQYAGYCDPAVDRYVANVSVRWVSSYSQELSGLESGQLDFGGVQTPTGVQPLLGYEALGKLTLLGVPALAVFEQNYVLDWSATQRARAGFPGTDNIPANFFAYEASRGLLQAAYPFASIQSNVWTADGLQTLLPVGGPIPQGLGCYYAPTTANGCHNSYLVDFAYEQHHGAVDTNAADVGSAGWWWAQGTNPSSPYYDPALANCTSASPCQFTLESSAGNPPDDAMETLWANSISSVTGGAVQPNVKDVSASDLLNTSGPTLLDCGQGASGQDPCPIYNFGWITDYPDPTDLVDAYGVANATYTRPDAVSTLFHPGFDNAASCGHQVSLASGSFSANLDDLLYWAAQANGTNDAAIANACQGDAYLAYLWGVDTAAPLLAGPERILLYDLTQSVLSALNLYTWIGQSNSYSAAATWLDPATVNTNPWVGGNGVQFWFQFRYAILIGTNVTFRESGLPKGTVWSVVVGGQTLAGSGRSLSATLSTGTYTYSVTGSDQYTPAAAGGTVTVTSAPTTIRVKFLDAGSTVTFEEKGLPKGTLWNVTVLSAAGASTTSKISLRLGAGTYAYTVDPIPGYTITPATGTFSAMPPKALTVKVVFAPYHGYGVTFTPGHLPSEPWTVHLKLTKGTGLLHPKPGTQHAATNGSIRWTDLANGTYTYTVAAKGFASAPGTFVIDGANASVTVNFTARGLPAPRSAAPILVAAPAPPIAVAVVFRVGS
jgi:hypothetical protein